MCVCIQIYIYIYIYIRNQAFTMGLQHQDQQQRSFYGNMMGYNIDNQCYGLFRSIWALTPTLGKMMENHPGFWVDTNSGLYGIAHRNR